MAHATIQAMSTFRITYDGPALYTSQMDVRELAPALLAVGDLLQSATLALYGDRVQPQVDVRGSFKTGSFGIDFALGADWVSRIKDLMAGNEATAAANALAILGALGWAVKKTALPGLFSVLTWLKGRAIERVEMREHIAVIHVQGELLEIELQVLTLLRDVSVRQGCEKVLRPMENAGITSFSVGDDTGAVSQRVETAQRAWFATPQVADELLVNEVRKMVFSIVALAFKDENKWRLHDGASTLHAVINDAEFLARVDANQVNFAKGDILLCDVRVKQWRTSTGARTEYEVVRVIEHSTPGRQLSLPGV